MPSGGGKQSCLIDVSKIQIVFLKAVKKPEVDFRDGTGVASDEAGIQSSGAVDGEGQTRDEGNLNPH